MVADSCQREGRTAIDGLIGGPRLTPQEISDEALAEFK
jgi:hypothetical protein